jgi:hypothetical protein
VGCSCIMIILLASLTISSVEYISKSIDRWWFKHRTSNEMRPMPPVSGSYIPGTVVLWTMMSIKDTC